MKKIRLLPSKKEVPYTEGESVLSCLEKNGFALPNNCRAGACGECKVVVKSGEIEQGFILDMALSKEDREQGYALMCMAKLKSDVLEIEWADDEARPKLFPPMENVQYMLIEKIPVTEKIVKLKLKALGTPVRFWPGQCVQLGFADKNIPLKSYSIANIPNNDGELVLYVTKVKNGVTSQYIHQHFNVGERVKINGPYGTFVGDPSSERPVLCLAQGSGLAPIMSLAMAAMLRGGFKYPATVLFSAKKNEDLFELGLFKFLETKFRNFRFKYTLTGEEEAPLKGRIQSLLPGLYPDLSSYDIYIAGNPDFVVDCKKTALSLNAKSDRLFTESFHAHTLDPAAN